MRSPTEFDVAVIGAGVFGAWTALELRRAKLRVVLVDAYGPGNSRSSSGDESRIIRMSYGDAGIYTGFAQQSLPKWIELSDQSTDPLFHPTGVLFTALPSTPHFEKSREALENAGILFEYLDNASLRSRYPQIHFAENSLGLLEPDSGALMARRSVRSVVAAATKLGVVYRQDAVSVSPAKGKLDAVATGGNERIAADQFVFACGAWLPSLFPSLMKSRIHPTRQEVFYLGTPPGAAKFRKPAMPIWIDFGLDIYALPDLESRGVKFAIDRHGAAFDPEFGDRQVTAESIRSVRQMLTRYMPDLASAPLVETRVCQYENSNNGDFIIDRHPDLENVWIAGGGSGHGFKHGPAIGEYVSAMLRGNSQAEPRFLFAAQPATWERSIY